ncbi:ABC transporter substrate-binding protein [Paenibacillus sp.]|uniref:ABC transporter substrate-binding protein n=1 Tax=Paenibacillus sp. TaxID=58172 RepID=UPI002D383091|nr:extracellular solute-binding protein [Paenibacillus sp.]HZG83684.1 extracellular solute-binding protein [Paenibacillus sp.]
MKRQLRRGILLCLIGALALVFAACSSGQPAAEAPAQGDASGSAQGSEPAAAEKEKATLRFAWWGSEVRHKALLAAIDKYMELNPHVTIEPEYSGFEGYYQKLVTQFAGGTGPDLTPLSVDWINEIAVKGDLVMDLYTLKDHINLAAFDQAFLEQYVVHGGELVGLPMGVNGMTIAYNRAFFEKFGIPEDTVWDWAKIHEIGKKVHEQDPNAYLLGMFDYRGFLQPYVNQKTGNQWINEDKTLGFDEAAVADALAYYKKLLDDGVLQPVEESSLYPDVTENLQWQNGNIGMMFTLASAMAKVKTHVPDIGVAMFPIPADAKTSAVLVNPSNPLAINKKTAHPEEAAKFASWLLTDPAAAEILKDVYSVPAAAANAQALADKGLIDATTQQAVEIALQRPGNPVNALSNNQELAQISIDIMEQVAFGAMTPEQGAAEIVKRVTAKLKDIQ